MARWHKWRGTGMDRRAFLGGAASMIALPSLLSLPGTARATTTGAPMRLIYWYVPNGMRMDKFIPVDTGPNYTMSELLTPITPHRDKCLVLSNVSQSPGAYPLPGDHARGTAAFLTARTAAIPGEPVLLGPSVDYLASLSPRAQSTRLASLHLATDNAGTSGTCDSNYPCAYQNSITWSSDTTPVPPRTDPRNAFDALFLGYDPAASLASQERRHARRSSVLDYVAAEAQTLESRLSSHDRAKLEQYLTGVRELELRVAANPPDPNELSSCTPGTAPLPFTSFDEHFDQMLDIMVLAMQCDATRVLSFMADRSGSYRSFASIGVPEAHHEMSHWNFSVLEADHRLTQWQAICHWHVEKFAAFLARLDSTADLDGGTLLDNCMVFFSSEIGDGHSHNHHDMPVVLAGGGCGQVDTGKHHRFASREPLANLFLGMLDAFGAPQAAFGVDGTRIMPDVFLTP